MTQEIDQTITTHTTKPAEPFDTAGIASTQDGCQPPIHAPAHAPLLALPRGRPKQRTHGTATLRVPTPLVNQVRLFSQKNYRPMIQVVEHALASYLDAHDTDIHQELQRATLDMTRAFERVLSLGKMLGLKGESDAQ